MKNLSPTIQAHLATGATKAQLRAISDAEVQRIYRVGYWDVARAEALRMASAQPARPIPEMPGRNPLAALLAAVINLFRR